MKERIVNGCYVPFLVALLSSSERVKQAVGARLWPIPLANRTLQSSPPLEGEAECPCLPQEELNQRRAFENVFSSENGIRDDSFGVGCRQHDLRFMEDCRSDAPVCDSDHLADCQKSYCQSYWCYVDSRNCSVAHTPSSLALEGVSYSYATCHYPDDYSYDWTTLKGKRVKVALNHNTGGWVGAYNVHGSENSFLGPISDWYGPTIDMMLEMVRVGQFDYEITQFPEQLLDASANFWNSKSKFSACIYAATMGIVDLCVAQYGITSHRASVGNWMILNENPLYVVMPDLSAPMSLIQRFQENAGLIYQGFKTELWIFVICFVVPVFGLVMVILEHGSPGSVFPDKEFVVYKSHDRDEPDVIRERRIPYRTHAVRAFYLVLVAVFHLGYDMPTTTAAGKIHLIGVSFFILTITAVYMANLSAILTQQQQSKPISDIRDAASKGYKFCISRGNMEVITELDWRAKDALFVVDPIERGGDGKPGFDSGLLRTRVFEDIDTGKADRGIPGYCHGAVTSIADLELEQYEGRYCNLQTIGPSVGTVLTGMAMSPTYANQLSPLMQLLINNGFYGRLMLDKQPQPQCPRSIPLSQGENASLGIQELAGIWLFTFGFSFLGLFVTLCRPKWKHYRDYRRKETRLKVRRFDQFGKTLNCMERGDEWIFESGERDVQSGRTFLSKDLYNLTSSSSSSNRRTHGLIDSLHSLRLMYHEVSQKVDKTEVVDETWYNDMNAGVLGLADSTVEKSRAQMTNARSMGSSNIQISEKRKGSMQKPKVRKRSFNTGQATSLIV